MEWERSSAGEHCIDIAGVTGSIPVVPTIYFNDLAVKSSKSLFYAPPYPH